MVNSQPTNNAKPANNAKPTNNAKPANNAKPNNNAKPANNLNNNAKKLRDLAVKLATNAIEKARQQMPNNA